MGTKESNKPENGKGGNFDTRKNPFADRKKPTGDAPDCASAMHLGAALDGALKAGCAVMIGMTRDGGALVLTILDGDDRHRTYCSTEAELDEAVEAMVRLYE